MQFTVSSAKGTHFGRSAAVKHVLVQRGDFINPASSKGHDALNQLVEPVAHDQEVNFSGPEEEGKVSTQRSLENIDGLKERTFSNVLGAISALKRKALN